MKLIGEGANAQVFRAYCKDAEIQKFVIVAVKISQVNRFAYQFRPGTRSHVLNGKY
jgi:hypothetical protein